MAFTLTTRSSLREQVLARLGELGTDLFFTLQEIDFATHDALHMLASLTGYYREERTLTLAGHTSPLYSTSQFATLRDFDLIPLMRSRLMERGETEIRTIGSPPYDYEVLWATWLGPMWDIYTVLPVLAQRRDRFLADTGIITSTHSIAIDGTSSTVYEVDLPETVLDVRRVVYRTGASGGRTARDYPLHPTDTYGAQSPGLALTPSSLPESFSVSDAGPLTLTLYPPYNGPAATLELHVVRSGDALTGAGPYGGFATGLGIPDDFVWGVAWGAIADLLGGHNEYADPARSQFAASMYDVAVQAAKARPTRILSARLSNGTPLGLTTYYDLDTHSPGWQQHAPGTPRVLALSGDSLAALYPRPTYQVARSLTVQAQLVTPPPAFPLFSALGDDVLPIGREELGGLVEWIMASLLFKCGAYELNQQIQRANVIFTNAEAFNRRLRAKSPFLAWPPTRNDLLRRPYEAVENSPATVEARRDDSLAERNRRRSLGRG